MEIDRLLVRQAEQQANIDKQLENLKELSAKATANVRVEQQNRELTNRSTKQQAEISELKKRVKTLQRDLAETHEENKALMQYDQARMKNNLAVNKKKLAETEESLVKTLKILDEGESTVEHLTQQIDAIHQSLSWRITKPLRISSDLG